MAIGGQFAGLPIDMLIGAPLTAAAKASLLMANSTANFIDRVGFDEKGKLRTADFMYQKRSMNDDGTSNLDEMRIQVPMLAITPIPNLQVDEVNVIFDMEVKQSERDSSETSASASATVSRKGWFAPSFSVSGSVSAHSTHTRSTDNSAKYHVDVRATNHGTPEGLARVLDMLAANVAPALVSSTLKDGDGRTLSETARAKAENLKILRQEISQIETRLGAARDGLNTWVSQLKNIAARQQNEFKGLLTQKINETNDEGEKATYSQALSQIEDSWNAFQNNTAEMVELAASSKTDGGTDGGTGKVIASFALKGIKDKEAGDYNDSEASCKEQFIAAQDKAVSAQRSVDDIMGELSEAKSAYSDAMAANTTSKPAIGGDQG